MLNLIWGSPCSGNRLLQPIWQSDFNQSLSNQMIWWKILPERLEKRTSDQIWLIEPVTMAEEEWYFYEKSFPYIVRYLVDNQDKPLIIEGSELLPNQASSQDLDLSYWCIISSADFQIVQYAKENGCLHFTTFFQS